MKRNTQKAPSSFALLRKLDGKTKAEVIKAMRDSKDYMEFEVQDKKYVLRKVEF